MTPGLEPQWLGSMGAPPPGGTIRSEDGEHTADLMAGKRTTVAVIMAVALLIVAGCTSDPEEVAEATIRQTSEDLIRNQVADGAGLGELAAACPDIERFGAQPGMTWDCTATTADQRIIGIRAVINDQGQVEVATTNMIAAAALPSFERAAVRALNDTVGSRLEDDAVDCGDLPVVFGQSRVMVCALFDPHTQETYDISLDVQDIETRQFTLVVADQPRP